MKRIVLITFILSFTTAAMAQDLPDFEAELHALETNQMKTEEKQMRNVDAVTDVISDEVGTGQAGIQRTETNEDKEVLNSAPLKKEVPRVRRIRSR